MGNNPPLSSVSNPGGLLLIDKPKDFTSSDIVAIARRALHTKRIGHSGTLDPMATGLLILLVERQATRLQSRFLKLSKVYQATLQLGIETDTWDAEGQEVSRQAIPSLTLQQVKKATATLTGPVRQPIPPFSAKKINGRKMYDLAREGQAVTDRFNTVEIFSWDNLAYQEDKISFTLHCSCGTYVRSLGLMLARALGTTGHLTALRRQNIGPFSVRDALPGEKLKTLSQPEIVQFLQSPVIAEP